MSHSPNQSDSALEDCLSFTEERYWYLEQLEPGNPAYIVAGGARLCGPLNLAAYREALSDMFDRHEILRTSYHQVRGRPTRRIVPTVDGYLSVCDLRQEARFDSDDFVSEILAGAARTPIDISCPPLLRITIIQLDDHEWITVCAAHHIIFDRISALVFSRELMTIYDHRCRNLSAPLAQIGLQYSDYARLQKRYKDSEPWNRQAAYWHRQLQNVSSLCLPRDRTPQNIGSSAGAAESIRLPLSLAEALALIAREQNATFFMIGIAAFAVLLHCLTRCEDILIGADLANRTIPETQDLIGCFTNEAPVRIILSGDPSFEEIVARVSAVCLDVYEHQEYPFLEMLRLRPRSKIVGRAPLFDVKLALNRPIVDGATYEDLTITPIELEPAGVELDLTLFLEQKPDSLLATLYYNSGFYRPSSVQRFLDELRRVLVVISSAPGTHLSSLAPTLPGLSASNLSSSE
jgi:Condensation domain